MKITIRKLKTLIREGVELETPKWAREWGWKKVSWQEFLSRFPTEAAAYASTMIQSEEEYQVDDPYYEGDPAEWVDLDDAACYVNAQGEPIIYANLTGAGGSLMLAWNGDDWDEVVYEDDGTLWDGN